MNDLALKIKIQEADFDTNHENNNLIVNNTGALVNFVGTVRGNLESSEKILSMTLEHYPGMTENEILNIVNKAIKKWKIEGVTVIHRVGRLLPEDKIVYVGVSSRHRQNAFDACNFIIDWLKTNAPFWKSEELEGIKNWVQARDEDTLALKKWNF